MKGRFNTKTAEKQNTERQNNTACIPSGRSLFVTGTGTDVGKTYVTALIVKKLRQLGRHAAYFKASVSGNERKDGLLIPGDAAFVKEFSGISQPLETMCPYVYEQAFSPHLAARLEGNPLVLPNVKAQFSSLLSSFDCVTVEGAGGILCPLRFDSQKIFLEDLIKALNLPCILVADAGLGTINAAGLTAFYLKQHKIPVKGIILNRFHPGDVMEEDNRRMCEAVTWLPVLACVKHGDTELSIEPEVLLSLYEKS